MESPVGLLGLIPVGALFICLGILALRFPTKAADIRVALESRTPMRLLGPSVRFVAIAWVILGSGWIVLICVYSIVYAFIAK
jgi:hypothetical protein